MTYILKRFLLSQVFLFALCFGNVSAYSSIDFHFDNPLFNAIEQNDTNDVITLIKSGAPIDMKEVFGITPLMRAVSKDNEEITKILLDLGADVNVSDIGGATALHIAARKGKGNIVKMLLNQNINIDAIDKDGWTALMRAVAVNKIENIELFLDKGANIFKRNNSGQSVITQAILNNNTAAIRAFTYRNLLKNLDHKDRNKLLKLAVKKNNSEIISLLELKPIALAKVEIEQDPLANIAKEDLAILQEGELTPNISEKQVEEIQITSNNLTLPETNQLESNLLIEAEGLESDKAIKSVDLKPIEQKAKIIQQPKSQQIESTEPIIPQPKIQNVNSPYWVEVSFNNYKDAYETYENHKDKIYNQALQIRMVKSIQDKNKFTIQTGPVATEQQVNNVCSILAINFNNCKIIKMISKNNQNRYK